MIYEHDFDRARAFCERSLALLQDLEAPAIPPNYELFYVFASGTNQALNKAVKEILSEKRQISPEDAERLCATYLSSGRVDTQLDEVGQQLSSEIGDILRHLDAATNCTQAFSLSLATVNDQLGRISNPQQAKIVVEKIIEASRRMAQNTSQLEGRLADSKSQIADLKESLEAVRAESMTDPLTGAANRKRFDHTLTEAIADAEMTGEPLCLLMMDIDHFKRFNDNFGHQAGDGVLKLVAQAMKSAVKGRDLVARYGGEEFAVVLPSTWIEDAVVVAEQIRNAVIGKELVKKSTGESLGTVTLSIGVAALKSGEDGESLIQRADAHLYAAKHGGRNQTKSELDELDEPAETEPAAVEISAA